MDHQTSVAPSKRTGDLTSKSLDANKPTACARPGSVPVHRSSNSVDWAAEDKKDWFLAAATASHQDALVAGRRPPPTQAPTFATECSTDASSEENLPSASASVSVSDLRVSGDSVGSDCGGSGGSSGGKEGGGSGPLRIWAPGEGALSRESPTADVAFMAEGDGDSASPPRSAESDVELISPKGFWREDFETIDARNATRRFSGWEDGASGKEESRGEGVSGPGGSREREGSGGGSSRADRAGGGRPPLRKDGGNPTALEDQKDLCGEGVGTGVKVGRKLFSSPEKPPPPPPPRRKTPPSAVKSSKNSSALPSAGRHLEAMAEGDHESPSPMGPPGGGPHPPPFWATSVEPARDAGAGGRGGRAAEKEDAAVAGAGAGLGWRRGESGLVIPEPMPQPKPRPMMIQSVVPQRASRVGAEAQQGGGGGGSGDAKRPLAAPRPATTSPTLPTAGEHKSKAPKELQQVLTPGVKIVRSYSYHGLGSIALYDSTKRG